MAKECFFRISGRIRAKKVEIDSVYQRFVVLMGAFFYFVSLYTSLYDFSCPP